jgi:hypothetical protein
MLSQSGMLCPADKALGKLSSSYLAYRGAWYVASSSMITLYILEMLSTVTVLDCLSFVDVITESHSRTISFVYPQN